LRKTTNLEYFSQQSCPSTSNKELPKEGQAEIVHVHQACITKNMQGNNIHGTE
jgi:hypothetical protein